MTSKYSAFTFIEILVVATIIIILTTIGMASFRTANQSARDAKEKSDLESIRQAMVLYKTQYGSYPVGAGPNHYSSLTTELIAKNTLSPPAPKDASGNDYVLSTSGGYNTASTFCVCAVMDNTAKGNSGPNCSFTATSNYCVRQP
jgi:type II secretory pathway pseudopilin PulG